jgi:hypothetical protein
MSRLGAGSTLSAMTPESGLPTSEMGGYILDALRPGGPSKDLADILDDVDFAQRLVPSREELNDALAELLASGSIVEVGSRTFRRPATPGAAGPFTPLTKAEYDDVVTENHRRFEEALVGVNRSLPMRGIDALFKLQYRLTGGRRGIAPEWTDLEGTSAAMIVFNRVAEAGGFCLPDDPDASTFNVSGVPVPRRPELRDAIRAGLEGHRLPTANLRLRFDDGTEMQIAGDSEQGPR